MTIRTRPGAAPRLTSQCLQGRPALAVLLVGALAGCGVSTNPEGPELLVDSSHDPIVGGDAVPTCAWPSAVFFRTSACSGALVHPRVVVTAAHCQPASGQIVSFGEGAPWAFSLTTLRCASGPGRIAGSVLGDWAYCVLPEDDRVDGMAIAPPLFACEQRAAVRAGAVVTAVGFGDSAVHSADLGTKRAVELVVDAVDVDGVILVGDKQHGLCHGDSGGPVYAQVLFADGDRGWRLVGTGSGRAGATCEGTATVVPIAQHVEAIQQGEHIDVTPCGDGTGASAPGSVCGGFAVDPGLARGAWPACTVGNITGPLSSCDVMPTDVDVDDRPNEVGEAPCALHCGLEPTAALSQAWPVVLLALAGRVFRRRIVRGAHWRSTNDHSKAVREAVVKGVKSEIACSGHES